MVGHFGKRKMTPEDRLNYLHNELEQLLIKQKRYQSDQVRDKDDLAWYMKCNQHYIQAITKEIAVLEKKNGA